MTLLSIFGNGLTAFGPSLCILLFYLSKEPRWVMLMLTSAFIYLLSVLTVSLIWYLSPLGHAVGMKLMALSVLVQGGMRYLCFKMIQKGADVLFIADTDKRTRIAQAEHAFASGFGWGLMSGLVSYITPLVESLHPGVLEAKSCPNLDIFYIGAWTTLLFIGLHTTWTMILFSTWSSNSLFKPVWVTSVLVSHASASFATLLIGSQVHLGCMYSCIIQLALLMMNVGVLMFPKSKSD